MAKGQKGKLYIKNYDFKCDDCERVFSSKNERLSQKLLDLHYRKVHGIKKVEKIDASALLNPIDTKSKQTKEQVKQIQSRVTKDYNDITGLKPYLV